MKSRFIHAVIMITVILITARLPVNAQFEQTELPANGTHQTILTITETGRYAIEAKSKSGVAIRLVDRRSGPGEIEGKPGESDGRIDTFLTEGIYRLETTGHDNASDTVNLSLKSFTEKSQNAKKIPEYQLIETELNDYEQRSFWLEIPRQTSVHIQVAGRSLADAELWKNGIWRVESKTRKSLISPEIGHTLTMIESVAVLEKGSYRFTCYGGPKQDWADDSKASPLLILNGFKQLPASGRFQFTLTPFGIDRYILPSDSVHFRLELPEPADAELKVEKYVKNRLPESDRGGPRDVITNEHRLAIAEIDLHSYPQDFRLVTVKGCHNQSYTLQTMQESVDLNRLEKGKIFISTIHAGHPYDRADITTIITEWPHYDYSKVHVADDRAIHIGQEDYYAQKFNLLGDVELFLYFKSSGEYELLTRGTAASCSIEPFFQVRADRRVNPQAFPSGNAMDLNSGYYRLKISPGKKGIIELVIRGNGNKTFTWQDLDAGDIKYSPKQISNVFESFSLRGDHRYRVHFNHQPEVDNGLIARKAPLNLDSSLYLSLHEDETVLLDAYLPQTSKLSAVMPGGATLPISLTGDDWRESIIAEGGKHNIRIRNPTMESKEFMLRSISVSMMKDKSLPAFDINQLAKMQPYPRIGADEPVYFDLERQGIQTLLLMVDEPGIYRISSSGLLATEGHVRTQLTPRLFSDKMGGTGRNFVIQSYLSPGEYQIRVNALGKSAGHLGISMDHSKPLEAGLLQPDCPQYLTLMKNEAAEYRMVVSRKSEYKIFAKSMTGILKCRLDDENGWPLVKPGIRADFTQELNIGEYRLILLPENREIRIVTEVIPIAETTKIRGIGPNRLDPGKQYQAIWTESTENEARIPAAWDFELTAPSPVTLLLSDNMTGDLLHMNNDNKMEIVAVSMENGEKEKLESGKYRLNLKAKRKNNLLEYNVKIRTEYLIPGMTLDVNVPSEMIISVPDTHGNGLPIPVVIWSEGNIDVSASLYKESNFLAWQDDRPNNWNFFINEWLRPGLYTLQLKTAGNMSGQSTIKMEVPGAVENSVKLPLESDFELPGSGRFIQLEKGLEGLLLCEMQTDSPVTVSIGSHFVDMGIKENGFQGEDIRFAFPVSSNERVSIFMRPMTNCPVQSNLAMTLIQPPVFSEHRLRHGIQLETVSGTSIRCQCARIDVDHPGLFKVTNGIKGLETSPAAGRACKVLQENRIHAADTTLWLVNFADQNNVKIQAVREYLDSNRDYLLNVSSGDTISFDVKQKTGPVAIKATMLKGNPILKSGHEENEFAIHYSRDGHTVLAAVKEGRQVTAELGVLNAENSGTQKARIRIYDFSGQWFETPIKNIDTIVLTGGEFQTKILQPELKSLRVTLQEDMVILLAGNNINPRLIWSEGQSSQHWIETETKSMTWMNLSDMHRKGTAVVHENNTGRCFLVTSSMPFESYQPANGFMHIEIESPGEEMALHVRGDIMDIPQFVDSNGNPIFSHDPQVKNSGHLTVRDAHGPVAIWLEKPNKYGMGLLNIDLPSSILDILPPERMETADTRMVFRIQMNTAVMIHVNTGVPVVAGLMDGGREFANFYPSGSALNAYLPEGYGLIGLRRFMDSGGLGAVEVTHSQVSEPSDGIFEPVLLSPGESRAFRFETTGENRLGIGVSSSSSLVRCRLIDGQGLVLDTGINMLGEIAGGEYFIIVDLDAESRPAEVMPVIVGLDSPGRGPPVNIKQEYVQSAGGDR